MARKKANFAAAKSISQQFRSCYVFKKISNGAQNGSYAAYTVPFTI
jgi:hypothetical protein